MSEWGSSATLAAFREGVLVRSHRPDLRIYDDHIVEVAKQFIVTGIANAILGFEAVEKYAGKECADRLRVRAAAQLLRMSVKTLRCLLTGEDSWPVLPPLA